MTRNLLRPVRLLAATVAVAAGIAGFATVPAGSDAAPQLRPASIDVSPGADRF
jgi:hypothetical protein